MATCKVCGIDHPGVFGSGKFCSRSCANSRKFSGVKKVKCNKCYLEFEADIRTPNSQILCIKCRAAKHPKKPCKKCGELPCPYPEICKKSIKLLVTYFGFNISKLGSIEFLKEYYRVTNLLKEEYQDTSLGFLSKKYNYPISYLQKLFVTLGLKTRTKEEGNRKRLLEEGINLVNSKSHFKQGWYHTWEDKQVFLRSSYEFKYAEKLDREKISYEVEALRILYWDSQLNKERVAIPDFYLLDQNKVIEIKAEKSIYFDPINMKDKEKAYLEHGYKFELVFMI